MEALPVPVTDALARLGQRLRQARIARKLTLDDMAAKVFVTPKTLRRVEAGMPGVSLATVASVLFVLGRTQDLEGLMADDRVLASRQQARFPQRVRRSGAGT